jgi:hypothetical protein
MIITKNRINLISQHTLHHVKIIAPHVSVHLFSTCRHTTYIYQLTLQEGRKSCKDQQIYIQTCRWLLTWDMVSPPTPISCKTLLGVAPESSTQTHNVRTNYPQFIAKVHVGFPMGGTQQVQPNRNHTLEHKRKTREKIAEAKRWRESFDGGTTYCAGLPDCVWHGRSSGGDQASISGEEPLTCCTASPLQPYDLFRPPLPSLKIAKAFKLKLAC